MMRPSSQQHNQTLQYTKDSDDGAGEETEDDCGSCNSGLLTAKASNVKRREAIMKDSTGSGKQDAASSMHEKPSPETEILGWLRAIVSNERETIGAILSILNLYADGSITFEIARQHIAKELKGYDNQHDVNAGIEKALNNAASIAREEGRWDTFYRQVRRPAATPSTLTDFLEVDKTQKTPVSSLTGDHSPSKSKGSKGSRAKSTSRKEGDKKPAALPSADRKFKVEEDKKPTLLPSALDDEDDKKRAVVPSAHLSPRQESFQASIPELTSNQHAETTFPFARSFGQLNLRAGQGDASVQTPLSDGSLSYTNAPTLDTRSGSTAITTNTRSTIPSQESGRRKNTDEE